jgi:cysteine desulfurase family protein (TIGR01976 family)
MSVSAAATQASSTSEIRSYFPALQRRHGHSTVAYFDGPGGTQVPRQVVDRMSDYLLHHNANTHWAFPTSEETDALVHAARVAAADFLNGSPDEVAFGANMTTLAFHLARALGRGWGPGDEVVVTELDHHANVAPWTALAQERGITIRTVRLDTATGQLDFEDLERQVTGRCRLLAIGAASNALGTITDVAAAARVAQAVGAAVFVDAVHYAPHELVDVRRLGCDYLACSPYKFYGPHMGILWVRGDLLQELDVPRLIPAGDRGPERLETGTLSHEGMVGTTAAIDFLAGLGGRAGAARAARRGVRCAARAGRRPVQSAVGRTAGGAGGPHLRPAARQRPHAHHCVHGGRHPGDGGGPRPGRRRRVRLARRLLRAHGGGTAGTHARGPHPRRLCLLHVGGRRRPAGGRRGRREPRDYGLMKSPTVMVPGAVS